MGALGTLSLSPFDSSIYCVLLWSGVGLSDRLFQLWSLGRDAQNLVRCHFLPYESLAVVKHVPVNIDPWQKPCWGGVAEISVWSSPC